MAKTKEIVARAMKDQGFRDRLLTDPKGALQSEFGVELGQDMDVKVHQNSGSVINIVLPAVMEASSRTLSDAELAQVAGGRASRFDTLSCPIKW